MPISEQQRMLRMAGKYSAVGIEMCAAVGFGTWAGWWADKKFGTTPWLMWVGIVVGFGAAFKTVQRVVRDFKRDTQGTSGEPPVDKKLN